MKQYEVYSKLDYGKMTTDGYYHSWHYRNTEVLQECMKKV